jgi:hypothetical protein
LSFEMLRKPVYNTDACVKMTHPVTVQP